MKFVRFVCGLFGVLFIVLLSIRLGVFTGFSSNPKDTAISIKRPISESESWMNILQNGRKIGYSHSTLSKTANGYDLQETMRIKINTMGMVQDISLDMNGKLNLDYTLSAFNFAIRSGRFRFSANGTIRDDMLLINTQSADDSSQHTTIRIKDKIYVTSGIIHAIRYDELEAGKISSFQIFDPVSMSQEPIRVKVVGEEEIVNMGITKKTKKLEMTFKGASQQVWIGEAGELIKEEGMLGISFEKASRENVLFTAAMTSSQDLTKVASVPSNMNIEDADKLTRLELKIDGIAHKGVSLDGGRQSFENNVLIVNKETLADLISSMEGLSMGGAENAFLAPSPFVQSDHPKIKSLVKEIISQNDNPLERVSHIIDWIHKHIEKKPVLSLPDAVSTLTHRVGDCNEHAVLLAALARAAGIPAKIEAGLVYLNGRFYYHAWNLLYLGEWITADALFNQLPADVTHIRLTSGEVERQFDLINVIGRIKLRIIRKAK